MAEKNNIPEIRFKGFSGEWKQQKLGKVVNLENGFAFKSKYFQDEKTDVIVLTPGSVNIGGGFQEGKGHFYDLDGHFPIKFIFKSGDMFVTMTDLTPTAQALGFPAVVPEDGNTYLHNQRLGKLIGFEGDKSFLFQLLSTEKNQKKIVLTSSGTTVKHTSPQKFLGCENYFPPKKEQTKIGNYFQQLDTLITLHQDKHDKLLNVKKAMLEKMFPKKGADVPEIRFKGFSEKWEERELINVAKYRNGKAHEKDIDKKGKYIVVNSKFISTNAEIKKFSKKQIGPLFKNEIAFVLSDVPNGRAIARTFLVEEDNKYTLNQRIAGITPVESTDSYFLYILMNRNPYFLRFDDGAKQTNLAKNDVENFSDFYPSKKEQTKIGNFFKNLDTLLTLHQSELTKLKNIKKTCLEKMFV